MATRYLYAVSPDGQVIRRRTGRDYRYAVLAHHDQDGWGAWSFSGTFEGAQKASGEAVRYGGYRPDQLVIATVTDIKPT